MRTGFTRVRKEFSMASLRATGSRTVCPLVGLLAVAVSCAPCRRGRALPGRLLRLPPRLAHPAGRPAQRRDPGIPLPAAPRGAARAVGQRDLPPRRLGRRRGGRPVVPGAAHGQRPGAADEPDLPHRRPRVGGLRRRGRRAAPVARRHGRGRVPVSHEPPLLPVRVDGGQPGPPGGAAAARGHVPRGQVARAGRGGVPVRHHRRITACAWRTRARRSWRTSTTG